jgi:hypothetical protein|nr:MAG TPA: hypothetical protein [Caudoviricetes sp.]
MSKYEIITYSRSTGDIAHSKRLYTIRWNAEAAMRTAGYTQNPRLPDIWYSEKYYAKVKEIVP